MKSKTAAFVVPLFLCLLQQPALLKAQPAGCTYKDPIIKIDFGNESGGQGISLSSLRRYDRVEGGCPDDGNYSVASSTMDCFNGNWHNLAVDHTDGDEGGRMMVVNAAHQPGVFFMLNVGGLKAGATYEFASWIINICRVGYQCTNIPPLLKVTILSQGSPLKSFTTGEIYPASDPLWKRYSAAFIMPTESSAITLQIENENPGGCGNDFAIDDITLRECVLQEAPAKQPPRQEQVTAGKPAPVPPPKKPIVVENSPEQLPARKLPATEVPVVTRKERTELPGIIAVPTVITTRANPVIKRVITEAAELTIELYDNGQVDGDTVSIYHNNKLIKSSAALSEKPVTIKIKVDKEQPHHELIMVAENLGSIPPNTSLMIITAKGKRYEVFISSSEQKNAKIIIDLQE